MISVYILYSTILDRFYTGCTGDVLDQRIKKHLSDHNGFTSRAKDWALVYHETFEDKTLALKREKEIKGWKSQKRIRKLIGSGE
ncbi:MAG: GIY-YIG nuclease family protein [Chitinophagaceae bacterium]|nr:GIY-YIG nuclease family protein [Chitinophagaceae bacterium]